MHDHPTTAEERKRSRLGQLALERGLLTRDELDALVRREEERALKAPRRLGEALVAERYASADLLGELLEDQRHRRHTPLPGKFKVPGRGEQTLEDYLAHARATGAQEVLFVPGRPPAFRRDGAILALGGEAALDRDAVAKLAAIAFPADEVARIGRSGGTATRAIAMRPGRYRATLSTSVAGFGLALRAIGLDPSKLGALPPEVAKLADLEVGLVVIASRSATTRESVLAGLVATINERGKRHVIEIARHPTYEHPTRRSLVVQREVGRDVPSHDAGLRAALREDPDVIVLGDLGEPDAIATALLAAETGHLVLAAGHGSDAAASLARLVDVQDTAKRSLVRASLADAFQAVVVADTVPGISKQTFLVADVVRRTPSVSRLIREDRLHQLSATTGAGTSRDEAILRLLSRDAISLAVALEHASDPAHIRILEVTRDHH